VPAIVATISTASSTIASFTEQRNAAAVSQPGGFVAFIRGAGSRTALEKGGT